jgi:hypothetical protein
MTFMGFKFHRVYVTGEMNTENILKACTNIGLKPACDYPSYSDGKCAVISGASAFHLSHGAHNNQYGFKPEAGAYFYSGRANGKWALQNTPGSHRWSNAGDKSGNTYCVEPLKRERDFKFNGKILKRVSVKGTMTNKAIAKACIAKGMKAVCDHQTYMDGRCVIMQASTSVWHFSYPPHDRQYGVPVDVVRGAYFYSGKGNEWPHQNTGNTHRRTSYYDMDGDTFCVKVSGRLQVQ